MDTIYQVDENASENNYPKPAQEYEIPNMTQVLRDRHPYVHLPNIRLTYIINDQGSEAARNSSGNVSARFNFGRSLVRPVIADEELLGSGLHQNRGLSHSLNANEAENICVNTISQDLTAESINHGLEERVLVLNAGTHTLENTPVTRVVLNLVLSTSVAGSSPATNVRQLPHCPLSQESVSEYSVDNPYDEIPETQERTNLELNSHILLRRFLQKYKLILPIVFAFLIIAGFLVVDRYIIGTYNAYLLILFQFIRLIQSFLTS